MPRVPLEQLQSSVEKILDEYVDDVDRKSKECVRKVARSGVKALKGSSPSKSGKYASGWTSEVEEGRMQATATLYNGKKPGLPHLLEHGHATRNGTGRVFPPTPAHPHIAAVEETLVNEFEKAIRVEI